VDRVRAVWAKARPELDTTPMAVVARVGRLARYLDGGLDELFARFGLQRISWDVLASLRRVGPPYQLSPTDLYRGLMRTSGAMTNRLHRLERMGLVSRVPDPADGRSTLVVLTPEGRELVDRVAQAHMDNERHLLAALSQEEQLQLADLLKKLLVSFEAEQPVAPASEEQHGDPDIAGADPMR
jgi:DNA-binding MarR family transcriptional regulator